MVNIKFQHNTDRLLEITKNTIDKSPKHFTTDGLSAYTNHLNVYLVKKLNIILIFTYVKITIITRWNDLMAHSEIMN